MDTLLSPSGIDELGDMSWGTHFCLFYETKDDLLSFCLPFFKAGLAQHLFCLYVAWEPLASDEALEAMRQAIPDFHHYLAAGQLEITPHTNWYFKDGRFDEQRALQGWLDKLDQALSRGFAGLRFVGNNLLQAAEWGSYARFESRLDDILRNRRMEGLCAFELNRYSAANALDVVRQHQFTLARRGGRWEPVEGASLKHAHDQVLKLNAELEQRVQERTTQLGAANEQLQREIVERRRSEEALRASEARLQTALLGADIGLWDWDLASGRVTTLGYYDQIFGFAPGEFDGKFSSLERRIHPDDLERLSRAVRSAREERAEYAQEYRVIWPDGSIHFISGWGRFVYDDAGQPVRLAVAVLDSTQRRQAEEALRHSERVLREAETLGHTGSWEQDLVTGEIFNTQENLRLFFGDGASKATPFEDYAQAVHPDDRDYVLQRHQQLLTEGGPGDIEYRVVWPDGSLHVIFGRATVVRDESGRAIRVYGTNVDITERKRAEAEIRRHDARMEVLAGVSQAMAHVGLDVQAVCETLVRYSAEVIGDAARISVLSDDGQAFQPVAFHHPKPEIKARWGYLLTTTPIPARQEWFAQLLRTGQGVLVPVIDQKQVQQLILPEYIPYLEQGGIYSILIVPLRVEGRVIGSLFLSRDQPEHPYTADDQVLLQDLADRAALIIQNAQLFQSVNAQRDRLRGLSARLVEAQEAERRHIARELHDEVGQVLTRLRMTLQMSSRQEPGALRASLDQAQQLIGRLMDQIQDLSLALRPTMLDDLGLVPALLWHIEHYRQQTGIQVQFEQSAADRRFAPQVETAAYRIVQEALTNVARHSGAQAVAVHVGIDNSTLTVQIEDAGAGFEVAAMWATRVASGLSGMRERAELLGGELTVESAPGAGTQITAELPLRVEDARRPNEPHDFAGG
jgi:PAS domain S-box-containing protein